MKMMQILSIMEVLKQKLEQELQELNPRLDGLTYSGEGRKVIKKGPKKGMWYFFHIWKAPDGTEGPYAMFVSHAREGKTHGLTIN